jgi:hypothetical protein
MRHKCLVNQRISISTPNTTARKNVPLYCCTSTSSHAPHNSETLVWWIRDEIGLWTAFLCFFLPSCGSFVPAIVASTYVSQRTGWFINIVPLSERSINANSYPSSCTKKSARNGTASGSMIPRIHQ